MTTKRIKIMNTNGIIVAGIVAIAVVLLVWWLRYGQCDYSFRIGNVSGCVSDNSIKIQ